MRRYLQLCVYEVCVFLMKLVQFVINSLDRLVPPNKCMHATIRKQLVAKTHTYINLLSAT